MAAGPAEKRLRLIRKKLLKEDTAAAHSGEAREM
jgi:hypothetical protein